jgi:predicted ATPase
VLDNLEHLRGVESVVADLLIGETVVIATSRASLRLSAERELQVDPLPEDAAVELFVSRAAAVGRAVASDEVTAAVCRRLDNLPLAVELAAARSKLLSPSALLSRLDAALPLLTGGVSDLPERQRTLRATIEWSHDLLDVDLRTAFRRLSIFRGSFTLDAAEAITGAGLDQLEALLDQSLLKPLGGERFFQLETIREYAREQLAEAGETDQLGLEHAHHYLRQLREYESHVRGARRGALLSWFDEEEENLRAAVDRLEDLSPAEAAEAVSLLIAYWLPRNQLIEARRRVERILAAVALSDSLHGYLLSSLADCAFRSGDHEVALAAATDALALAEQAGDPETLGTALFTISMLAIDRGDFDEAWDVLTQALERGVDDPSAEALLHAGRASVAVFADRDEEARAEFQAARACFREAGDEANDVSTAIELAEFEVFVGDCDVAAAILIPALEWSRMVGDRYRQGGAACVLGFAEIGRGRQLEATVAFGEALELVVASERTNSVAFAAVLSGIAFAAGPRLAREAARLLGAAARINTEAGLVAAPRQRELRARAIEPLIQSLGVDEWTCEHAAGSTQPLEETIALALRLVDSSL